MTPFFSFKRLGWLMGAFVPLCGSAQEIRIGIVGTDTTHTVVLSRVFNDPAAPDHVAGARVVCAFKGGSPDIPLSANRVDQMAAQAAAKYGVAIVGSIADVLARSDAIAILSLDGRVHLAQARDVFPSGKPVFFDKPLAGSLADAVAIVRLAQRTHTPFFSASSFRFADDMIRLKAKPVGEVRGAIAYGPAVIESHVPDLAYYGIHSVEALYAVLGPGCESLTCLHTADTDVVSGLWQGGRTGTVYALRTARGFQVTEFGTKAIASEGQPTAYRELAERMLQFFRTRRAPVSTPEMLEVIAFVQAADQSKRLNGAPVPVAALIPADLR